MYSEENMSSRNIRKTKNVMISVYKDIWDEFTNNCKKDYKTASGVIRELIIRWNRENGSKEYRKEK